ncbi:MAG: hypothetical protein K2O58_10005 [Bacteroidales bacterium]|nr:hypothetical protein [Bacteroidales bacterium]MDE7128203.1 hypothetical protein [Bacteroidales bacterium]
MKRLLIITLLSVALPWALCAQQIITYSYDAAGNRSSRNSLILVLGEGAVEALTLVEDVAESIPQNIMNACHQDMEYVFDMLFNGRDYLALLDDSCLGFDSALTDKYAGKYVLTVVHRYDNANIGSHYHLRKKEIKI